MKIKNSLSNMYVKAGVVATLAMSSTAFAETSQSTNYLDGLVAKLDVAPIITAIASVAVSIMGITVVVYGIRKVFRMFNA